LLELNSIREKSLLQFRLLLLPNLHQKVLITILISGVKEVVIVLEIFSAALFIVIFDFNGFVMPAATFVS
jgi:hypothetical protein